MSSQSTGPKAIAIQRFSQPAEKIFEAWTDPKKIEQWMFGVDSLEQEQVLHIKTNPKVGGEFSFLIKRRGQEIDHIGKYLEVQSPELLVFSWGVKGDKSTSQVKVEITAGDSGSKLKLTHSIDPEWAEHVEYIKASWTKMLEALNRFLEKTK